MRGAIACMHSLMTRKGEGDSGDDGEGWGGVGYIILSLSAHVICRFCASLRRRDIW
jgi:hypothetical protein